MNHKVAAELRFVGATGIAIGGAMPLIFSMLGDIFGIDRRAMVLPSSTPLPRSLDG